MAQVKRVLLYLFISLFLGLIILGQAGILMKSGWKQLESNQYKHEKTGFKIKFPTDWRLNTHDNTSLNLILLTKDPPQILKASLLILIDDEALFYQGDLSAYAKHKLTQLKTGLEVKNLKLIKKEKVSIRNLKGIKILLEGENKSGEIFIENYFFLTPEAGFLFSFTVKKEDFLSIENNVMSVLSGVQFSHL